MSPVNYVQETARTFAVHLAPNYGGNLRLLKRAGNLFKIGYDPELDTSPELYPYTASYYLTMSYYLTIVGILRWTIELGRINIIIKVLLLSSDVALPREGHLDAAVHFTAHVSQRYISRLVYDPW